MKRTNLISLDYHHDSDHSFVEVGALDVGISSEVDNYIKNFGEDEARERIFDQIIIDMLGRFVKFHGNDDLRELYKKILSLIKDELDKKKV